MTDFDDILKKYNITKGRRDGDVNTDLSTMREVTSNKEYHPGEFFKRLLNRIQLVDDFSEGFIAYASFNFEARRLIIGMNPYLMWEHVLRPVFLHHTKKENILYIDQMMLETLRKGGWTAKNFKTWMNFFNTTAFCDDIKNRKDKKESFGYSKDGGTDNPIVNVFLSIVIHEILHIVWNHVASYQRNKKDFDKLTDAEKLRDMKLRNIAMDFAINQTLNFDIIEPMLMTKTNQKLLMAFHEGGAPMAVSKDGTTKTCTEKNIRIDDFNTGVFLNQPFEYYLTFLEKCPEKFIKIIEVPGGIGGLFGHRDGFTQFEEFNEMSTEMKKVAGNDLKRVIDEMLDQGKIDSAKDIINQRPFNINDYFMKIIEDLYPTETKSWEYILSHFVRKAMGAQDHSYSMKRECRSVPDMFPGKERDNGLDLNFIVDVSGSINHDDFNRFVNEMVKITSDVDIPMVRYIQFHSEIGFDEEVPVSHIKSIGVQSTGGTNMFVGLNKLREDKNDKLTIIFTDGYVEESTKQKDYDFDVIIFVSASGNQYQCRKLIENGFKVIWQDGNNAWFDEV